MEPNLTEERVKLLEQIKGQFETELEKRGYLSKKEVEDAVTADFATRFKDVDLEALRAYETNNDKVELTLRTLALELEKMKAAGHRAKEVRNAFEEAFRNDEAVEMLKRIFNSRGASKEELVINVRALNQVMTTANTVDLTAIPDDLLNSFSIGAFVKKRQPVEWIFNIASRTTVPALDQNEVWLEEGNIDGAFAIVTEGATKPYVSGGLVWNAARAKKVAAKWVITEELSKFMQNILNIIEGLIRDKILRDYNDILATDLLADAASYTGTSLDGKFPAPTYYHVLGAVSAQIETLNFKPDTLILHPQDKWLMFLEQDETGRFFLNIPTVTPDGQTKIINLTVYTSTKIPLGTGIIGEGGLWKVKDEAITTRIGYGIEVVKDGANVTSVTSDFDNNRLRMIVELWFMDYIPTPYVGSFVEFDFEDVKAALTAP